MIMVRLIHNREERDYLILAKKRNPVGQISGAKRDFEMEATAKEPDMDDFRSWLLDMDLKNADFYKKAEEQWKLWTDKEGGLKTSECDIFWTGQSHIDIAWEWTLPQTIEKSVVTYGKAVYHGENIPNFIFAGSQALTYEFVRQRDPELFAKIQDMHKKGRFELVGGSWVEPDCRMPNGEGFIRERLYGQHYYMKYFNNTISKVEWTPDTFGYAWNMPQIIKKSGGEYFFTTKVWGNSKDYPNAPWPFTNFMWEGPDGSKVLTHIQPQMFSPIDSWPNTKKKSRLVKKGKTLTANYLTEGPQDHELLSDEPNDYVRELGVFYGLGDGGHGPTGKEVQVVEHFLKEGRGEYKSVHDYFSTLDKYKDRLPIWNDELYFQQHHGTLTTQALVKKGIRMLEWRTAGLEAITTLIEMIGGSEVPYADLTQVWKDILTNHFHDIFPGSSIPEVYDDTYDHFLQDMEILDKIEGEILSFVSNQFENDSNLQISEGLPVLIINPLGFKRKSIVSLSISEDIGKTINSIRINQNGTDSIIPVQFEKGESFERGLVMERPDRLEFLIELNAFEILRANLLEFKVDVNKIDNSIDIKESDTQIEVLNGETKTIIDKKTGNITSCKWKGKELFDKPSFELKAFGDMENVWEIQTNFREWEMEWELIDSPKVVENGPVRTVVEYTTRFEDGDSDFIHRLVFYNGMDEIVSEIIVDWIDPGIIIKMNYSLAYNPINSIAEIPAAVIKRLIVPETSHDKARWENNCQTFVDMPSPDNKWGIAFVNDSKYGFATPNPNDFELTLLRKARYPKIAAESWSFPERRERVSNGGYVATTSDEYPHVIRQVIIPHENTWGESEVVNKAHAFNSPVISGITSTKVDSAKKPKNNIISKVLQDFNKLIQTNNLKLEILALKVWEPIIASGKPGYILRIVNNTDSLVQANIEFNRILGVENIIETDMLERPLSIYDANNEPEYKYDSENGILSTNWTPFSIRTFLLM